jgi:hypothetical protein
MSFFAGAKNEPLWLLNRITAYITNISKDISNHRINTMVDYSKQRVAIP